MVQVQMLFVNKFCSNLKYYNIKHDIPDLVFKSILSFQHELSKRFPLQSQQLEQILKIVHS